MDSRPSCPPPIPLKQSQQHISTRSKYTPLKRGVSNTSSGSLSKSDVERLSSDVAGLTMKVSPTNEDGAKLEKSKSKVSFFQWYVCLLPRRSNLTSSSSCLQLCGRTQILPTSTSLLPTILHFSRI